MSRKDRDDLEVVEMLPDGRQLIGEAPSAGPALRVRRPLARRSVVALGVAAGLAVGAAVGGAVGYGTGRHAQTTAAARASASSAGSALGGSALSGAASGASGGSGSPSAAAGQAQYNSGAGPCDRLAVTSTQLVPSAGLIRAITAHFPGIVVSALTISRYVDDDEICSADATGTDQAVEVEVSLRFFGIAADGAQTATTAGVGHFTESATRNFFLQRYSVSLEFDAQRADQLPTAAALQGFITEPLLAART